MVVWQRLIENLFARVDGPFHLRLILQPSMSIIFAVIDGVKDAKQGRPPYLWTAVSSLEHRKGLAKSGWKRVSKIFILAVILDIVYQLKVNRWTYPGETLLVASFLAIVPYLLVRGPVNRLIQWRRAK